MTQQTIHNTEAEAQAEVDAINALLSNYYERGTTAYTCACPHPTDGTWAVRYNVGGYRWAKIERYMAESGILDNLVYITEDWA